MVCPFLVLRSDAGVPVGEKMARESGNLHKGDRKELFIFMMIQSLFWNPKRPKNGTKMVANEWNLRIREKSGSDLGGNSFEKRLLQCFQGQMAGLIYSCVDSKVFAWHVPEWFEFPLFW